MVCSRRLPPPRYFRKSARTARSAHIAHWGSLRGFNHLNNCLSPRRPSSRPRSGRRLLLGLGCTVSVGSLLCLERATLCRVCARVQVGLVRPGPGKPPRRANGRTSTAAVPRSRPSVRCTRCSNSVPLPRHLHCESGRNAGAAVSITACEQRQRPEAGRRRQF